MRNADDLAGACTSRSYTIRSARTWGYCKSARYPNGADAARILAALIRDIPGGQVVDTAAIVAALPERTSGSDIREVVRRAVLAGDGGSISTATLLAEVGSGCYRARGLAGMYP